MKLPSSQVGCLTVDVAAIRRNWQLLCDRVAVGVEVAAVVKADAYGLGIAAVVLALYRQGCRHFYVATLAEGIALREILGADACIFLLAGVMAGSEFECTAHSLVPVLSSLAAVRRWAAHSHSCQHDQIKACPSIIKYDTGMSRLGLTDTELDDLLAEPELLQMAQVTLFMSHLACADAAEHRQNVQQRVAFELAAQKMRRHLPELKLSLANSSGIFLGDEYHFDQVRPGAALYGINPILSHSSPVSAVVRLSLPILQLKMVEAGRSVGYGGDHCLTEQSCLAVVQGGYADGVHRTLAGRLCGYFAGICVPVVGRISMDTTIFDVTAVLAGGEVLVEGDFIQVLDGVADIPAGLGYEVLTSLGSRYQYLYSDEGYAGE